MSNPLFIRIYPAMRGTVMVAGNIHGCGWSVVVSDGRWSCSKMVVASECAWGSLVVVRDVARTVQG